MQTVRVPSGTHTLGWRHTLPAPARQGVEGFWTPEAFESAVSPSRTVEVAAFEIQLEPLGVEALLEDIDESVLDAVGDVVALCDVVDAVLGRTGRRLPTEDELEVAVGGGLFAWGDAIPEGTPYEPGPFDLHRQPTVHGLVMPHDSYQVELVRAAFKMGDGGSAVCGAYPWPIAWLTLCPAARVPEVLLDDLFVWVENAVVHPVRV